MAADLLSEGWTIWAIVHVVVLAIHMGMYKPWALPMPFKAVLPFVHVLLFSSITWSVATAWVAYSVTSEIERINTIMVLHVVGLILGLLHTYLFFVNKHYGIAVCVMTLAVLVTLGEAILLTFVGSNIAVPVFAAGGWMSFVVFSNYKRWIATLKKKQGD